MPLFLMGCFPVDFQDVKRPLRTKSVKRPIKVGKRPINEGKRPIKAKVLVGVSVGSLMGCFRATPPWRKTAPLKRPIKRSMKLDQKTHTHRELGEQLGQTSQTALRASPRDSPQISEVRGFSLTPPGVAAVPPSGWVVKDSPCLYSSREWETHFLTTIWC